MRFTLLLFIIVALNANGQQFPKTGKVVADQNFKCNEHATFPWAHTFVDSILSGYALNNICLSQNDIEIRFVTFYAPSSRFDLVILTFNDETGWKGKKFELNLDTIYGDAATNAERGKIIEHELKTAKELNALFSTLVKNDVFKLPDMTKVRSRIHWPKDGLLHSLTFKVQNKYRTYRFDNTDYFVENSRKKIFKKYHAIVQLFRKELQFN